MVGDRRAIRTANSDSSTAATSVTVSPAAANRPSECATTPVTTRAAANAMLRASTNRRRNSRVTSTRLRPLPTQLSQAPVADAEVVAHLVDHRAPHLLDDFVLGVADGADRAPVDGDPVGQRARVAGPPGRQRHALIEPEQARVRRLLLDEHADVLHVLAELFGDAVEGVSHQLLEPRAGHVDHLATLRRLDEYPVLASLAWDVRTVEPLGDDAR